MKGKKHAMRSFEVDVWIRGVHIGRTVLAGDLPTARQRSVGSSAEIGVVGDGILPTHLWIGAHRGSFFAASVDPERPALICGRPIATRWERMDLPCEVRFGEAARLTVRALPVQTAPEEKYPSGATRVHALEPPRRSSDASPPALVTTDHTPGPQAIPPSVAGRVSPRGGMLADLMRLLRTRTGRMVVAGGSALPVLALACVLILRARSRPSPVPPAPVQRTFVPVPRAAAMASDAAAPGADASTAPAAPSERDVLAERRIAEALFGGDFARALAQCETLAAAHPDAADYAVMLRVLRARRSRMRPAAQ